MTKNTAEKLTVAKLKKFHARPDVIAAIAAVKAAKVEAERVRTHVDSYIEPALADYEFTHKRTGKRITRTKDLYLIPESQEERCTAFYAQCDKLHAANGYQGFEPGVCPALSAEWKLTQAENVLLAKIEELTDAQFTMLDARTKVLELFLNPPRR